MIPLNGFPLLKSNTINPIKKVDIPDRAPRDTPKAMGSILPNFMIITLLFFLIINPLFIIMMAIGSKYKRPVA